jgi:hypothetical protein
MCLTSGLPPLFLDELKEAGSRASEYFDGSPCFVDP